MWKRNRKGEGGEMSDQPKPTTIAADKAQGEFLLPCPFCGSENVGVESLTGGFVVDCKDCGGGCGTCHDEQAARDEWNKRKSGTTALDAAIEKKRLEIWRDAPNQPDVQEAVILAKLDLVHRHAIEKAVAEATKELADELKSTTTQLATERHNAAAAQQSLVDALKYIAAGEHADEAPEIAQAALAKEGKS
jgi:hypothetical protein